MLLSTNIFDDFIFDVAVLIFMFYLLLSNVFLFLLFFKVLWGRFQQELQDQ
jgi:hypothetical protein